MEHTSRTPVTADAPVARNRIPGRIADALRRFPPFSMFPPEVVESLAAEATVRVAVKDDILWKQGDAPGEELLFLSQGRVEYLWKQGDQQELVDVRDVGDLLGLTALVESSHFQVTAVAVEDCLLYGLPWAEVSGWIEGHDEARNYVKRHLFWVTRVGGMATLPLEPAKSTPAGIQGRAKTILDAHIDGARLVRARGPERLVCCGPHDSIRHAAELMSAHEVGSVLVVDGERHPLGMVTAAALVDHAIVGGGDVSAPVAGVMASPVVTVSENSSATAATLLMMQRKIGFVCVTRDGTPDSPALDVCTEKDLMTQSGYHPAGLIRELVRTRGVARARELSDEMERLAGLYLAGGVSSILVGQICAEFYDALTRRLIAMALDESARRAEEIPDVPWAWMAVGSDGRREQILRTDMDNAIVFRASGSEDTDEKHRRLLLKLAARVVEMMVDCGISRCQGGVMASNPKWCRTDAEWTTELSIDRFAIDPERMLRALVLYDLRHVDGDVSLVEPLRTLIFDQVPRNAGVMNRIAELVADPSPPLNFLGKLVVEKKGGREVEFDLKGRGLAPFREAARLLALKHGLSKRYSTGGRWEEIGIHVPELAEIAPLARESYDFLMRTRVLNGLKRHDSGRFLDPSALTKLERAMLANVFDVLRMLQRRIRTDFRLDARLR